MPPVFGPLSPSKARLWSCAVASGSACSPSHSAKKDASSPSMNSSITTSAPALAEFAAEHHVDGGERFLVSHGHDDALAGGQTVGLDDDRRALSEHIGSRAFAIGEMLIRRGRNMLGAAQRLGEALRAFQSARRFRRSERFEARRR